MSDRVEHKITEMLREWQSGNKHAAEQLFPLVYDELKRRAKYHLSSERSNHTLQPTALVHEAYLKLVGQTVLSAENRIHFFGIASRVMRQILVDHARGTKAEKRGGGAQTISIDDLLIIPASSAARLLDLDAALNKLEQYDNRKCRVVDMRFFGGLSESEIATVLGVHEKTVKRDWQFAKLWLYRELSQGELPA